MAIDATIVSLTSDIDLASGEVTNFLSLKIPTGQILRAVISDDSAVCLRQLVQVPAPPAAAQVMPAVAYAEFPPEIHEGLGRAEPKASLMSVDEDGTGQI